MVSQIDRYTLGKTLGMGFSAKVKVAQDDEGRKVAIKIIDMSKIANKDAFVLQLREEIRIIQQIQHKNFVSYYEF